MAKMTAAQIERMNAQLPDGWELDISENQKHKSLEKRIPIGERAFLSASLCYALNWDRDTQKPDLVLWVRVAHEETDRKGRVCSVSFWRTCVLIEQNCAKRDFKKLCRVAATITSDDIKRYARNYRKEDDEYYKLA